MLIFLLKLYLTTVLIWFIIIFASTLICIPSIIDKVGIKSKFKPDFKTIVQSALIAAIPIVRLLFVIGLCTMMFTDKNNITVNKKENK